MKRSRNETQLAIVPRLAIASAVSLALFAGSAVAGTDTADLSVSASVIDNCTISTTALAFGNYDPIVANAAGGDDLDGTGTVTVTCTLEDVVQIELGVGLQEDGVSNPADPARQLFDGGDNYLAYFLYSDIGHTTKWATGAAVDVESTGTGAAVEHTVYGQVTKGQNQPAGNYADTVVATVTF